jgi:hypothetical protein
VISKVLRVPLLSADATGVRLPLHGVRLTWAEVAAVRPAADPHHRPILLIFPSDPQATVRGMRPWVRHEARTNITRYGTPLTVPQATTDRTVAEMRAAIAQWHPTAPADQPSGRN